jgi:DUF3099 family protein
MADYREIVPGRRKPRGDQAYLVTEARQSRSAEISQRERRYLMLMGIRIVCFIIAVVCVLNHVGWLAVLPAAGAIVLPYFAVVVANARRQTGAGSLRPYQPNLPDRRPPDPGPRPVPGEVADEPAVQPANWAADKPADQVADQPDPDLSQ